MGGFVRLYDRVKPLDIAEVDTRQKDSIHAKAAMRRRYGSGAVCIAGNCCCAPMYGSVLCIAHRKGLGLTREQIVSERSFLSYIK